MNYAFADYGKSVIFIAERYLGPKLDFSFNPDPVFIRFLITALLKNPYIGLNQGLRMDV